MVAQLSDYDRSNVGNIISGEGDWFSAELLRLIAKADVENREQLRVAFPDHVEAYEQWAGFSAARETEAYQEALTEAAENEDSGIDADQLLQELRQERAGGEDETTEGSRTDEEED